MSTEAQIQANRQNAKRSTGPTSAAGKNIASLNHTRHGLAGAFRVLPTESQADFDAFLTALREEHQPETVTESALVDAMAEHHWLRRRALNLESSCYDPVTGHLADQKQLALYLRYQSTHERAFHKALNDLLKLRAEKRKAQIGFESQQRAQTENTRKQEKHDMKKERHKWDLILAEAKVFHEDGRKMDEELKQIEALFARERANRT
jgi:hypothetical protein